MDKWHRTPDQVKKRVYTVEEMAGILNIGRTSAYLLVKEDHFRIVRIGNAIRISKKSFDEWIIRYRADACPRQL